MAVTLDTFTTLAKATSFSTRGIVVRGQGKESTARLGNFITLIAFAKKRKQLRGFTMKL